MNSGPATDVHPVFEAPVQHEADLGWNDRLTLLYKRHVESARFLFKIAATFGFIVAAVALLALAA
jgi:hypothetical protein